jgi:hypothetical protein
MLAGVALLAFATPSHARKHAQLCEGKVSPHNLSAYVAIESDDGCVFIANSPEGRRILQVCPIGSQCSVEAIVNNTVDALEINKVISVRRKDASRTSKKSCVIADPTGTPLNVRSRPNGSILGSLFNDREVFITDMAEVGGRKWAKVVPLGEGKAGWVFRDYLTCK